MFIHVVCFWCKPGTEAAQQEMIRYAQERMPQIASVKQVFAGTCVPSPREVVDSSYQVGLCVIFNDQAGHDLYQPHDIHQAFVSRFKENWTRVRVYDFQ